MRRPTIVLVERDPYLAFLIRLHVPEAQVIEAEADASLQAIQGLEPDLVVAGIEGAPFPPAELIQAGGTTKVLVVVDGARSARSAIPSAIDGVIARPFAPADLSRAVRSALRLGPREEDDRDAGPALARARALIPPLRIGALALTAVLEISAREVPTQRSYILAIAFGYATLRWVWRRTSLLAETSDIAVAIALIAATGGVPSNYLPFAAVVAASTGLMRGPQWGMLGGLLIVAGSIPLVVSDLDLGLVNGREAVAWATLFPLVGLTGGFAARVWRHPTFEGLNVLVEANRVLSSLYRIARTLPGGLEIGSVAEAATHEIRDAMGAEAAAMMVADAGTFAVVGSFGLADPSSVLIRDPERGLGSAVYGDARVLKTQDLHPATAKALGEHDCWLAAPMRQAGIAHGLLLAACPDEERHEANLLLLRRLADEATVAVENARLFSRVREISIDEERRRLARELHDGIAQSLTHLRYELDFMARHVEGREEIKHDVQRLIRVVERTSSEVRSMILGLRTAVADEGLIGALRSYLGDLQRLGGPALVFDARGEVKLPGDVEAEIFRVAQEAVSNALRHSQARRINVRVESGTTKLRLLVEDDGVGLPSKRLKPGRGVGMDAMRERAELIDATLSIGPANGGGTRVELDYPIGVKQ